MTHRTGDLIAVYFVDPHPLGTEFDRSPWPLHMTIVPWFDATQTQADTALSQAARSVPPFDAQVGHTQMFGPDRTLPASVVRPLGAVRHLYSVTMQALSKVGANITPAWTADFDPHITHQDGRACAEGNTLRIASLSLVRLFCENRLRVVGEYQLTGVFGIE